MPIDERADRNPAFDAQRTVGQHQRPARQAAAHPGQVRRRLHGAVRQPVPAGHAEDPSGDLRDGPAQPVPVRGRPAHRRRLRRRLLAGRGRARTRRADRPGTAAGCASTSPANYGWPYCVGPDLPYVDYDFATGASGAPFNCRRPVNDSPHNTGLTRLPPVAAGRGRLLVRRVGGVPGAGQGGIGPMGGPAYDYDRRSPSRTKWPEYYDGVPLFYEWTRDYIKEFRLDRRGDVADIRPVLPSLVFDNPMDMEFGPDGALYVLEYGDGFFAENPDAQLSRFDFVRGNRTPIPEISADAAGRAGAADGHVLQRRHGRPGRRRAAVRVGLRRQRHGRLDRAEPDVHVTANGAYRPTLKVTDSTGRSASADAAVRWSGRGHRWSTFVTPVDGPAVRVRPDGRVPGERARRRAGRLRPGHRDLHPRATTSTGTRSPPRPGARGTHHHVLDPGTAGPTTWPPCSSPSTPTRPATRVRRRRPARPTVVLDPTRRPEPPCAGPCGQRPGRCPQGRRDSFGSATLRR